MYKYILQTIRQKYNDEINIITTAHTFSRDDLDKSRTHFRSAHNVGRRLWSFIGCFWR